MRVLVAASIILLLVACKNDLWKHFIEQNTWGKAKGQAESCARWIILEKEIPVLGFTVEPPTHLEQKRFIAEWFKQQMTTCMEE